MCSALLMAQNCQELSNNINIVRTEWCWSPKMAAIMPTDLCSDLLSTVARNPPFFSFNLLALTFWLLLPSNGIPLGLGFCFLFQICLLFCSDLTLCWLHSSLKTCDLSPSYLPELPPHVFPIVYWTSPVGYSMVSQITRVQN
jgi:hypothetical protein